MAGRRWEIKRPAKVPVMKHRTVPRGHGCACGWSRRGWPDPNVNPNLMESKESSESAWKEAWLTPLPLQEFLIIQCTVNKIFRVRDERLIELKMLGFPIMNRRESTPCYFEQRGIRHRHQQW